MSIRDAQKRVENFHRMMSVRQPVGKVAVSPVIDTPDLRDGDLRAQLILEEAIETAIAAVGHDRARDLIFDQVKSQLGLTLKVVQGNGSQAPDLSVAWLPPDFEGAIDGLCDTIYVCLGAAVTWGIDLQPFFDAVCDANDAKEGGRMREDGKWLKPEGWKPPDIAGILEQQKQRK